MRRSLIWTLLATLVLSAVALFMPERSPEVASIATTIPTHQPQANTMAPSDAAPQAVPAASEPLPAILSRFSLEPAKRDIFALAIPVAPRPAPLPVVVSPPPVVIPPPPQPPPMNYRFWGRMKTPEGQHITYLAKGENVLPVAPGTTLDDGWQVESLGDDSVALVYQALQQRVVIPIARAQNQ